MVVVMASSLPEFKKCLENPRTPMVYFLGSPVWSQRLDLTVLVDLFQLGIFCSTFQKCFGELFLPKGSSRS